MAYANGRLPKSALTEIQPGAFLATKTARAWKRLVQAAKTKLHRSVAAAGPAGAYRSAAVQHAMHLAGSGHDADAKRRWGLNASSVVAIADDPYGTHQDGRRIDIVGTPIDPAFLALAKQYGFTREFGARDPNHFMHDGTTATGALAAAVTPRPAAKGKPVTVKIGAHDTLSSIAARNHTDVETLLELNGWIHDRNRIPAGRSLRVR